MNPKEGPHNLHQGTKAQGCHQHRVMVQVLATQSFLGERGWDCTRSSAAALARSLSGSGEGWKMQTTPKELVGKRHYLEEA